MWHKCNIMCCRSEGKAHAEDQKSVVVKVFLFLLESCSRAPSILCMNAILFSTLIFSYLTLIRLGFLKLVFNFIELLTDK